MKYFLVSATLLFTCIWITSLAIEASTRDPLSGLPMAPGISKMSERAQNYLYCGSSARRVTYFGEGMNVAAESDWYARNLRSATVFTAADGIVTYISADGSSAVELAGPSISFRKFSPGLTPTQKLMFGSAPESTECRMTSMSQAAGLSVKLAPGYKSF
jgi:hypothetical protein